MNIIVFDTETTSVNKPFVYDIGYTIYDTESREIPQKRSYIVTDVWNNMMLFSTAYYADKRERYEQSLANREMVKHTFEWIVNRIMQDVEHYEITDGFAYNSPFDIGVFKFNCEWFHTPNPFDNVKIHDIRGYVHKTIAFTTEYRAFCDEHKLYTESGNYSTTAQDVYRFILNDSEFIESHTALADSEIELDILAVCVENGAKWGEDYKVYNSIAKHTLKDYKIICADGQTLTFPYTEKRKLPNDSGIRLSIKGDE